MCGQHSVRISAGDSTEQNTGKGHSSNPRIGIKIYRLRHGNGSPHLRLAHYRYAPCVHPMDSCVLASPLGQKRQIIILGVVLVTAQGEKLSRFPGQNYLALYWRYVQFCSKRMGRRQIVSSRNTTLRMLDSWKPRFTR